MPEIFYARRLSLIARLLNGHAPLSVIEAHVQELVHAAVARTQHCLGLIQEASPDADVTNP